MNLNHFWYSVCLFSIFCSNAQTTIKAQLLDAEQKTPIAYATISLNSKSGVISNENGVFNITITKKTTASDSLLISCLGYTEKKISIHNFKDSLIYLSSKSIGLSEVLITNKNYTVAQIIDKAKAGLIANYDVSSTKRKVFFRESFYNEMDKYDVNLKKSSIPEINQHLIDSLLRIMPKNTSEHTEILGELYGKIKTGKPQKMDILKSSYLYDKSTDINFDNYEKRFNAIFKKYVKRDSYFKIKSGWFSTKEAIDSTLFGDGEGEGEGEGEEQKKDIEIAVNPEKKKQDSLKKISQLQWQKYKINKFENNTFLDDDNALNFIHKSNRYEFELHDYTYIDNLPVYIINFEPKRGADYEGTLYINSEDFAIVRVDYKNVKPISRFSLLGISLNSYLKKGTIIFKKNENNTYAIKYIDETLGKQIGIKRPLKIVEKNKNVKGRRKQNEVNGSIHFIVKNIEKTELIVFETEVLSLVDFKNIKEKPYTKPTYLEQYDPNFWKGYNIIEPNEAIRNFKSIDKN